MKKLYIFLFSIALLQTAIGQITTPVIKANFGVDADLFSRFFNNAASPASDDWWYGAGLAGTGEYIIDTTGAAAIVSGYTTNPATRGMAFARVMRQEPYTILNNHLLLDAIFQRDFHGNDSTVFAAGSNKNAMSPALWSCPESQGIPDKNDILDAYAHVRRAGADVTDSAWMFAGISIENTNGSRYFDFELYQSNLVYNRSTQNFSGFGPDAGHTSWQFDAAGNISAPGDIIFTAEFGSGGLNLVEARLWIKKSQLSITPATFDWGGKFDGDGSAAVFGYASIQPKTLGDFYSGLQNTLVKTWAGPFSLVRVDNSVVTSYIQKQFMEFAVNLTKLGIDPALFSNNACGSPFRRVLIKTRASTSFTAELKDFIAPFSMFNYDKVDANAFIKYYCKVFPATATVQVYNPLSTSVYTWTTNNGSINGSTTGPVITVNAPGTYYVTQQLNSKCPASSIDSVVLLFDSVCAVLQVDITQFNVTNVGKDVLVKWQVNDNELVEKFEIEYSTDNRNFNKLTTLPANENRRLANYSFQYRIKNNDPVVYFRLKLIGKNGVPKQSRTISIQPGNSEITKTPVVFPNPANKEIWLSVESDEKAKVSIALSDVTGRFIQRLEIPVNQGGNVLALHNLVQLSPGMYFVKIKANNNETTQKFVLKK